MRESSSSAARSLVALAACALALTSSPPARAEGDDCPPGSVHKSLEGFTWCEPSVCSSDAQCGPGELCKPVALCVQVGSIDPKGAALADAGKRLVATQVCAPDKSCPATTTCLAGSRCVARAQAETMGLVPAAAGSAASGASGGASKKSCGCRAAGAGATAPASLALALAAAAVVIARRARRPADRA